MPHKVSVGDCWKVLRSVRQSDLHKFKKLSETTFLVASQMLRIGKHALDHLFGFIPISVNARVHELLAGSGSTAMCGDDLGDNGNELINGLHGPSSLDYDVETALAPPGFQSVGALVANATRRRLCILAAGPWILIHSS